MKTIVFFVLFLLALLTFWAPTQAAEPSVQDRVRVALALSRSTQSSDMDAITSDWLERLRTSGQPTPPVSLSKPPEPVKTTPVPKTCHCSQNCVCGCNDGKPCTCAPPRIIGSTGPVYQPAPVPVMGPTSMGVPVSSGFTGGAPCLT